MPNSRTQCYVIMPAGNKEEFRGGETESDYVYRHIKRGLESKPIAGRKISVTLETDKKEAGKITKSILESLIAADICIADLTGHNANVLIELGMRYCFKPGLTVLIAQDTSRIPSDIRSERIIQYSIFDPDTLIGDLRGIIKHGLNRDNGSQVRKSTSIVHDLIPGCQFTHSLDTVRTMPTHEFLTRVDQIVEELHNLLKDKSYVPSALFGLSKGGWSIVDSVAAKLERRGHRVLPRPLTEADGNFDSPENIGILNTLHNQFGRRPKPYNILLLDDHVATGKTAKRAIKVIKDTIPEADVQFLPLVCRNRKVLFKLFDEKILLWAHRAARRTKQQVQYMHLVEWHYFPDHKFIRQE
jgi:hypothetical protein